MGHGPERETRRRAEEFRNLTFLSLIRRSHSVGWLREKNWNQRNLFAYHLLLLLRESSKVGILFTIPRNYDHHPIDNCSSVSIEILSSLSGPSVLFHFSLFPSWSHYLSNCRLIQSAPLYLWTFSPKRLHVRTKGLSLFALFLEE